VAIQTFPVPGGRPDEICVLPAHLPFINYRGQNGAKDTADEQKLAGYDFYRAGSAESGAVAPLPKRSSTSAAVDVFALPAGTSRPEQLTASYCATVEKGGKCVAKFKQTDNEFTTTSTASILGYYHVARALGDICEIKPAVLRTMDIEQHKKVVRLAHEMGVHGTIEKSWGLFDRYYADPAHSGSAELCVRFAAAAMSRCTVSISAVALAAPFSQRPTVAPSPPGGGTTSPARGNSIVCAARAEFHSAPPKTDDHRRDFRTACRQQGGAPRGACARQCQDARSSRPPRLARCLSGRDHAADGVRRLRPHPGGPVRTRQRHP
jgi:hypothetical protein